ncbi:Anti-sigma regulatory factor (Ser/Thr protein kinase) [Lachnospiraceae bacterium RM5]|nr:Anti-sigma regulatory factor (Ser/Thr protein kinase) [Lachnospiraceae bacterium RM5]
MVEKEFIAKIDELPNVISFIEIELEKFEFSFKIITQFNLVVEELFVNVASYAYKDKENGKCKITIDYDKDKQELKLSMEDNGIKFNPLEKEDFDTTLSVEDRPIGGLGILLVKKNMDNIEYKYEDNKNILILSKNVK